LKEEIKKGDLVLWRSDDQFDLVAGPPRDNAEQLGIVVETRMLENAKGELAIRGVLVRWPEYDTDFWTPVEMLQVISES
tara:strand:+ start:240 stop:476 length:237 start_codon:yes stop_codon:yes gene_type:complete